MAVTGMGFVQMYLVLAVGKEHGNILQKKFENPSRWSYTFQDLAVFTRFKQADQRKQQTGIEFVERSLYSNRYNSTHCALGLQ